jgi:ribosomal protein L37E
VTWSCPTRRNSKKNEADAEKNEELNALLRRIQAAVSFDLEACEFSVRDAVLGLGARFLERALNKVGRGRRAEAVRCRRCGQVMASVGINYKTLRSILGAVRFGRSRFVCPRCGSQCFPADEELGIEHTAFTPGAQRMMAKAASRGTFAEAAEDLALYANLRVTAKTVERCAEAIGREIETWLSRQDAALLCQARALETPGAALGASPVMYIEYDGTGVPIRRAELQGRKGKQPDGSARTREVKLGCVFTQTTRDEQGHPLRDPNTTTYVGAIESSEAFGKRLYAEALRRGLYEHTQVVLITDGAQYNKSIAELHFPNAVRIIDLYHAFQHLHQLAASLVSEKMRDIIESRWGDLLDHGRIEELLEWATEYLPRAGNTRHEAITQINYFKTNTECMQYDVFRHQGFFVGSGVIEAGCKTVIGARLKASGMFWSEKGANAIIALRCCICSRRFEQFWEDRSAKTP